MKRYHQSIIFKVSACPEDRHRGLIVTMRRVSVFLPLMGLRAMSSYRLEPAYEPATMVYLADGVDTDYKQQVREALVKLTHNPSRKLGMVEAELTTMQTLQQLRLLSTSGLLSFAEIASTPRHFLSYYEILATCDSNLAIVAAEHLTFATTLAKFGRSDFCGDILNGVDSFRTVGAMAVNELLIDEPPYSTEVRFDRLSQKLLLRGAGKFGIVNALTASYAIVSATLTLSSTESRGTKLFLVRLRDADGVLLPGVSVSPVDQTAAHEGAALGVIHFDNVQLSRDDLLLPYTLTETGDIIGGENVRPLDDVTTSRMLSTAAIAAGLSKRMITDAVCFSANRATVGPSGNRDHLLLGLQHIQCDLVDLVVRLYTYLAGWHRVQESFCDPHSVPTREHEIQLAGIVHNFRSLVADVAAYLTKTARVHAMFVNSRVAEANSFLSLTQVGTDSSLLIRQVGVESIVANVGTTHWGWKVTNSLKGMGVVKRMLQNPLFSPHLSDMGRHLIFFGHKHYTLKHKLSSSRRLQERYGYEHVWYDWNAFKHRDVVACGDAFCEMFFIDTLMQETSKCLDLKGRRLLRDMNWTYSLSCMQKSSALLVREQLISSRRLRVIDEHFDNLCTLVAPQCVNLVESLKVPSSFLSPLSKPLAHYYSIPGTFVSGGDEVEVAGIRDETKEDQENIVEEDEPFDLLHGLGGRK